MRLLETLKVRNVPQLTVSWAVAVLRSDVIRDALWVTIYTYRVLLPMRVPLPEATETELKKLRGKKEQDVYISVIDTWTMKNKIYSDQTGKFPTQSRSGNQYIMVMVEIDSNCTLVEPMKNRTDEVMTGAYKALLKRLQRAGVRQPNTFLTINVQHS